MKLSPWVVVIGLGTLTLDVAPANAQVGCVICRYVPGPVCDGADHGYKNCRIWCEGSYCYCDGTEACFDPEGKIARVDPSTNVLYDLVFTDCGGALAQVFSSVAASPPTRVIRLSRLAESLARGPGQDEWWNTDENVPALGSGQVKQVVQMMQR